MKEIGTVQSVYIALEKGGQMQEEPFVSVSKKGIEGDRYFDNSGAFSGTRIPDEDRAVTLISLQAIEEANNTLRAQNVEPFSPQETRRNIVVDIPSSTLNSLVGKRFFVGLVELEGTELCSPCRRPPKIAHRLKDGEAFEDAFQNRGGLRARVVSPNILKEGDVVRLFEDLDISTS